jgi:hypothetical protein
MASLTLSNIPSHVNTFERLLVFAAMAIQSSANGKTVSVRAGEGPTPECQVQIGVGADNVARFAVSAYIPVDMNAINDPSEKTWMAAQEVSASAPHTNFSAN